ncbi:RNA polymerase sigma factor SigZ [Grimontia marina]|uniref:RNA polymerase sigma factor SigZ n=1 Tax=Grimontia marina TaxID=646534 RepID=A0A128F832_9GAMM|nr:RNA polymerase sigma factor SigZ [Grimontia marina]CZF82466.1 RNA polymerase sigma factor SigM [Grimontia marina]
MTTEAIWSEYQTSLKAFIRSKVSNPDDAEDLLQDILVKTYTSLPSLHERSKLKPWLFQIANNAIIDFYRRKRFDSNDSDEVGNELWLDEESPSVVQDLTKCILPFLHGLSESEAELLKAIEIDGVSQKDYAETHDINYSTLKSRLKKSRQNLMGLFNQCCKFSLDSQGNLLEYERRDGNCSKC